METGNQKGTNPYTVISAIVESSSATAILAQHLREDRAGLGATFPRWGLPANRSPPTTADHKLARSSLGESSPVELDSPDGVFKSPKSSSKFGIFTSLPFKTRRSSAPAGTQQLQKQPKTGLLTIPEQASSGLPAHKPVRIVVSSSEVELQRERNSLHPGSCEEGGNKLRRRREFGSTGDLLEVSSGLKISYKQNLGKSMEHLPVGRTSSLPQSEVGPFRSETGADCRRGDICALQPLDLHNHALLENPESETRWYFKYFLGKHHLNYLCNDVEKNPMFVSIVPSGNIYRCILWRKMGNKRLCVKNNSNGKWPSPKSILDKFSIKVERGFKEIMSPAIQKDLLTLEEQEGAVNFKFGVLYAKAGQNTDNEMYCNEEGSDRFHQFLDLLGDEVQLRGWQNFRGGLDNKNDSTGLSSVYTAFEGHEIMFHVSTLLPYTTANEQQLERKRHIGNDIVVIIYVDYDTDPEEAYRSATMDFDPSCMKSHFNHIFALVTYDPSMASYRLVLHSATSVPAFGPPLPFKGKFTDFVTFRDFLLAKLINGEKAAYCTPTFAQKRERTLNLLLKGVEKNFNQEMRRASSTPALNHSPNTYRKFNEREKAFTEFGQRLKVEKVITGHHPTSQRTTVNNKRDPWETECVVDAFPYKISHGDICGNGIFIVHTPNSGTYFIYSDGSYSLIMDQSIMIGQLVVAHRHQLVLFRTNHPKEVHYLYAIPLKQFYSESLKLANKAAISCYQVPHTKGISQFCTSHLGDQFLRLAVAVKNKVYMLAYKHPASMVLDGSPLTPASSTDPKENFIKHRELNLLDTPLHMTLLDERPSGKLCVTYHKLSVVDAIDEIKATTQRIPNLDIAKTKLTTLTSVQANGRSELLIAYNLTCQVITLHDGTAYNSMEIIWNTEPQDLVYLYPYMLSFTEHTVEIRMASNGSLMQTISVPDLRLISSKGDLYFTSSSCMVHTASCKTPTTSRSLSHLPTKLPKNMDRKDLATSGKFTEEEFTYIYKISLESMTGRRDLDQDCGFERSTSTHNSGYDESVCRSDVVSLNCDESSSNGRLDYIHPIFRDNDLPMRHQSFQEEGPRSFSSKQRRVNSAHLTSQASDISLTVSEYESSSPPSYVSMDTPSPPERVSSSESPKQSPSLTHKLKRSSRVLTSRKSLDTGSRWLYPYFSSTDNRYVGDSSMMGLMVDSRSGEPNRFSEDVPEILGLLENVVYASADNNVHEDLSLSETGSRGETHH